MGNRINYKSVFFKTQNGKEPVRVWVNGFKKQQREAISTDMLFVVTHFPNVPKKGMICKLSGYEDIWEIRIRLTNKTQIRILFLVHDSNIVFLHGFIKKSKKTPKKELDLANRRKREYLTSGEINNYEQESA
jgi:phage-related protein